LLDPEHPVGGPKAIYFRSRGYDLADAGALVATLRRLAEQGVVTDAETTVWGTKYLVVGTLTAPDGKPITLGSVWIVSGEGAPVLVTAYPMRRGRT